MPLETPEELQERFKSDLALVRSLVPRMKWIQAAPLREGFILRGRCHFYNTNTNEYIPYGYEICIPYLHYIPAKVNDDLPNIQSLLEHLCSVVNAYIDDTTSNHSKQDASSNPQRR